jgi:MFS family permease
MSGEQETPLTPPSAPDESYPAIVEPEPSAPNERPDAAGTFAAFKHRNFTLYWFGNLASLIGTWMQNIATGWLVLSLTNSAFYVGLNSALTWLPAWIVSLPAGALADRYSKRNIMIVTQSLLAVSALVLAVLTWTGTITIHHILLIAVISGFIVNINSPVTQSFVPELVGHKDVLNAIALNSTMFNAARIIGPSIAGVLLGVIGPGGCFGLNSASFLAIIIALAFIRIERPPRLETGHSIWRRLTSGLSFVRGHADVRTLIILVSVFSSVGMVYLPLMPVFARDVLHGGVRGYGIMMTCIGIGAVIGGLTLATISRTRHKGRILIGGTFALALLLIGFSFIRLMPLALVALVLMGFCQTTISSLTNTLIQTLAPEQVRGRVMSVFTLAFNGMFPVGSFLAGSIAQKLGAPAATFAGGCAVLVSMVAVLIYRPQLRSL